MHMRYYRLKHSSIIRGISTLLSRCIIGGFLTLSMSASAISFTPSRIYASGTYELDLNFNLTTDGVIYTMAQDDDYVYFGGSFFLVGKRRYNNMVLYNTSGNTIENFVDHPNGYVQAVFPDGSGGWYIGGNFDKVGSHNIQNLARIKPDRTVDTTWTPNPDNQVRTIFYDGTHVYIGGDFTIIGGQSINRLARVNPTTGLPDISWNPNPNGYVNKIIKDGSDIYVCGVFNTIQSTPRSGLAKLDAGTGSLLGWNPNPNNSVLDIDVSPSHVYVVGYFTTIDSTPRNYAAKLDKGTGAVDPTWNPNPDTWPTVIRYSSGGDIFVGGLFTFIGGDTRQYAAKLNNTNGDADPLWLPPYQINDMVLSILPSGANVYFGGNFNNLITEDGASYVISTNKTTGAKTPGWNFNFSNQVWTMAEQGSYIFMGGIFTVADGIRRQNIARFQKSNDQLDTVWDPRANNQIFKVMVDDAHVYVGGDFTTIGGAPRNKVARVNKTNGLTDPGWIVPSFGSADRVFSLGISPHHVYIGGDSSNPALRLQKVNKSDGSIVPSWSPNPDDIVRKVLYDTSGIYAGGEFTTIGGQPRNYLAKLDETTGLPDPSWNPSPDRAVIEIYKTDTNLFIGGFFTFIGTETRERIAKLNLDGTLDMSWSVSLDNYINTITTDSENVYFVGTFSDINGQGIGYGGKVNKQTGVLDTVFNLELTDKTYSIIVNSNAIYLGGAFGSIKNNQYFKNLAKITYALPTLSLNQNQSNISANNTQGKTNPLEAPKCNNEKPKGIPDLFQIDTKDTTAKLFFTPVYDSDSSYYISFSEDPSAEKHGALATLKKEGVQSYDIFFLQPNRTYYLKVRAQNGCATGEWSPIMTFTTNRKRNTRTTKVYRYEIKNGIKRVINTIENIKKRLNNY